MEKLVLTALHLLLALPIVTSCPLKKPNILLIWADDVGWADFQRNEPRMRTPQLERLAQMGMFMDNAYVMQSCVPSRSAMMTGRYPHNFGLQKNNIMGSRWAWLNETETLLPQVLQGFGYTTHMIGKWHLGFCDWDLTPTGRGFDTFYGMLMGASGYYNHSAYGSENASNNTYDFWDQNQIDWSAYGQYSTELFTARARQIIQNAPTDDPWFMFLSYQAAHGPFEVPEHYITTYCSHVSDRNRAIHCGMVAAMDQGIGEILDDLEAKGILRDTVILFMSDNGGPIKGGYSSNWPLRGEKQSYWEGGTRSFTIYKGNGDMAKTNFTYSGLFHAVDILPTFAKIAGRQDYTKPSHLDGYSLYWSLQKNRPSPREWMLYGVNDVKKTRVIRKGKWKLVQGSPGNKHGWYPSVDQQQADGAVYEDIKSGEIPDDQWQMFNIEEDPNERNDVFQTMQASDPDLITEMQAKLQVYWDQMVPWVRAPNTPEAGQLRNHYGHWMPGWCDVDVV